MLTNLGKPKVQTVSPAIAQRFLNQHAHYLGQRDLSTKRINHYAKEMRREEFFTNNIVLIQQEWNGGTEILANGHHTLEAIIVANAKIDLVIEKWSADTPQDFARAYGKFDNPIATRTILDYLKTQIHSLDLDWELPTSVANAVISGMTYRGPQQKLATNEKAELIADHLKEAKFFTSIFVETVPEGNKANTTKHMRRKAVYYAMFQTFVKCNRDAYVFWEQVRDGEGLHRQMPSFLLREFLINHVSLSTPGKKIASLHEISYKCIVTWNAFRAQRKMKSIRYFTSKPVPAPK